MRFGAHLFAAKALTHNGTRRDGLALVIGHPRTLDVQLPSHMVEHIVVGALNRSTDRRSHKPATESAHGHGRILCVHAPGPPVSPHSSGELGDAVSRWPLPRIDLILFVGVWFLDSRVRGAPHTWGSAADHYTVLALPVIATTGLVLWSSTNASLHNVGMNMQMSQSGCPRWGIVMMAFGTALMFSPRGGALGARGVAQRAIREPVGLKYA